MTTATVEVNHAEQNAQGWYDSIIEMVEKLEHAESCNEWDEDPDLNNCEYDQDYDDYHNAEQAREAILESVLSVEVRSGWATSKEEFAAEEFMILLTTGGPALRIRGELGEHNEPCRAWMEYQDWGTPWTQFFGANQETLLTFCRQFYFGE